MSEENSIGREILKNVRPAVKAIFHDEVPNILLLRHRNGMYILPGGAATFDELENYPAVLPSLLEILRRELEEEILDTFQTDQLIGSEPKLMAVIPWEKPGETAPNEYYPKRLRVDFVFTIKSDPFTLNVNPKLEIDDYVWVNPIQAAQLGKDVNLPKNTRMALSRFTALFLTYNDSVPHRKARQFANSMFQVFV